MCKQYSYLRLKGLKTHLLFSIIYNWLITDITEHVWYICKLTKLIQIPSHSKEYPDKKSVKKTFFFSNRTFSILVTISFFSSTSSLFLTYQDIIDNNIRMPYPPQTGKNGYMKVHLYIYFLPKEILLLLTHLI